MITEQQKTNIYRLPVADCLEMLEPIIDKTGLVSVAEYHKITGIPKRTIYQKMKDQKLKYYEISGIRFPIINA